MSLRFIIGMGNTNPQQKNIGTGDYINQNNKQLKIITIMDDKNNNKNDELIRAMQLAHCLEQSKWYESQLATYEREYKPTTKTWERLTIAETEHPQAVAAQVALYLTAAKHDGLKQPVNAISDLIMALRYKVKYYGFPPDERKGNPAYVILKMVYEASLNVVHDSLYDGSIPEDISEKVTDLIYEGA